jgi:hypothetical protein
MGIGANAAETDRQFAMSVAQSRESAFTAARRGRRFYSTHQTPGTAITGQAAFNVNTPTWLIRLNGTSVRLILRSISLTLVNTPTNAPNVTVSIDTADRFSAGGAAHVPQNTNEESATASGVTSVLANPTLAAAAPRDLVNDQLLNTQTSKITILFRDGILLGTSSNLMVYTWGAGGTQPDWYWVFEWEEVA